MESFGVFGLNLIYTITTLALISLGLAIVFGLLGVMNMAHGEFVMIGAYCALTVQQAGLNPLLAIPLALVACGLLGWAIERSVVRHLYRRPFDTLLATWGIAILIRKCVEAIFGRGYRSVDQSLAGTIDIAGIRYPTYRLVLITVILAAFAALFLWYRTSSTGARIKAMVSNPELAAAVGIDGDRLSCATFVFGVAIAGVAGVLLAPLGRVEPFMGLDYLLQAFFALVVGGLGSLEGLAFGSSIIGGSSVVASALLGNTGGYVAVLTIAIVFLWLSRDGLRAGR